MRLRWLALVVACGCSASSLTPFERHAKSAEQAYSEGRYEDAARSWHAAEHAADTGARRSEARYRAAASHERSGRVETARAEYRRIAGSAAERADRARYELLEFELQRSDDHEKAALLERFVRTEPASAFAPRTVFRFAELVRRSDRAHALARLGALAEAIDRYPVAEFVHYELGRALEAEGALPAARDRYLFVARRFPYPEGSLWDDALFRAAELQARLGDAATAVATLEQLLAERESSFWFGSYERPRYDDARFRIAELYRDELQSDERALHHFERLWQEHPDSILRDDAIWQAAVLAKRSGQPGLACEHGKRLLREAPDSRYAPCLSLICPELARDTNRRCRGYIAAAVEAP